MSEVKRYYVGKYGLVEGEALGRINVVLGADHDRVTADADRLRAELECSRGDFAQLERISEALQQRLTAADERADVLGGLLFSLPEGLKDLSGSENTAGVYACIDYIEQCIAGLQLVSALKPALATNDEHVCSGCGSKGWTANCSECVPY